AGTTLMVFNKNNQKLWEAKLTYPIAPSMDNDSGPALEVGSRLLFYDQGVLTAFDLKKGDVQWRVNSVGIRKLTPDSSGNVNPSSGKDQWEYYRRGAPEAVRPKQKQILLQFQKELRLLKYL